MKAEMRSKGRDFPPSGRNTLRLAREFRHVLQLNITLVLGNVPDLVFGE